MVRVLLDDGLDADRVQELVLLLVQVDDDVGAALAALGLGDGELATAVRRPQPGVLAARLSRQHLDLLGDDERRIEADAELADHRQLILAGAVELVDEGLGAGARDGPQRPGQVIVVHADAVVRNGQGLGLFVDGEGDPEIGVAFGQFRLGQGLVTQPVAGVGRVGDQLAQEDFLMAVERMGDDIEKLADFRLKGECFFRHGVS